MVTKTSTMTLIQLNKSDGNKGPILINPNHILTIEFFEAGNFTKAQTRITLSGSQNFVVYVIENMEQIKELLHTYETK